MILPSRFSEDISFIVATFGFVAVMYNIFIKK